MATLTQERATDGQKKQLIRMAVDAAEKAAKGYTDADYLSKEAAERVKGDPEFVGRIHAAVVLAFAELSTTNKFKDEEVDSDYGYPSGYAPKSVTEQCNRLRDLFPGVGYPNQDLLAQIEKGDIELPNGAEGWFAIPNIWGSGRVLTDLFGGGYAPAVQKMLDTIKTTRDGRFYNWRDGQIDSAHLRQTKRTEDFLAALSEAQGNPDILIVAAQFGIRHRGRSVRRAREVFALSEFGLGAFANGIMLLTHPERLQHYDDLWIDCAGDEFAPVADGDFSHAPLFVFRGGGVGFNASWAYDAGEGYGSASGFGSQ